MKLIKLTVMFLSFDVIYDYKKDKGQPFWEDFTAIYEKLCCKNGIVVEKKGQMQYVFYTPSDESPAEFIKTAKEIAQEMIGDKKCIITGSEANDGDFVRLSEGNIDGFNSKGWNVTPPGTATEPVSTSSHDVIPPPAKIGEDTAETETETKRPKSVISFKSDSPKKEAPKPLPVPETLAEEAERIDKLKKALLSKVRGQHHAVDEFVQTVFECDAFTSRNESRHAPLASFLFTGPSGVGKTYLAKQCGELLGRASLVVDMSEFSDNLANGKFNGDYNQQPMVTGFVREHPDGIIVFDEIEKAHINTIHLFLQILDEGRLTDRKVNREVSFRDTIIIITTNAGKSLYDDATVCNLSAVPKNVILEALRTDRNPQTNEPYFPDCITTRFANGHVVLFNHLEPFALMEIVRDEIALQTELFKKSYGVEVEYDADKLSALVLYNAGGVSDARTLRGIARSTVVKELQEVVMTTYIHSGKEVNSLKKIKITIDPSQCDDSVRDLFVNRNDTNAVVFADKVAIDDMMPLAPQGINLECFSDTDAFKKRIRGVCDFVLIDPQAGLREMKYQPNDIEDCLSDGMDIFDYLGEYYPELPIYILDTRKKGITAYNNLLSRGARGVMELSVESPDEFREALANLAFGALINNASFTLGRSGKILTYNCSQYTLDDSTGVIDFSRLQLKLAPQSNDSNMMAKKTEQSKVTFADIIGCHAAKEALADFCKFIKNPREVLASGKRIPKGILLYGPPGTGKTMLAKAMANETDAAFFPITSTSLFSPYVGQSEANVREIFRKARRYAPSIIFIDEVDAIGRMRTGSEFTRHSEDVLNAFIAEMDGFSTDERRPVFIIAATNYEISGESGRVLDPAFVRRFDKRVFVDLPDADERYQFMEKQLKKHGIDFGKDTEKIIRNLAERSGGMSNADLDIVFDMFMRSVSDRVPNSADLMDALDAFRFGEVNKLDPKSLRQTACHEAGHAIINKLLAETPSFLTVVSRGNYGGFMEHAHDEGKANFTYAELMGRVCCALAGRAAEILVYGEEIGLNTGASSDIRSARYYIKTALEDYAMGDNLYGKPKMIDMESIMREQYARASELLAANREALDKLTELLVSKKSLDKTELETFFGEFVAAKA